MSDLKRINTDAILICLRQNNVLTSQYMRAIIVALTGYRANLLLYIISRGDHCNLSARTAAKYLGMSRSTYQIIITEFIDLKIIKCIKKGSSPKDGSIYVKNCTKICEIIVEGILREREISLRINPTPRANKQEKTKINAIKSLTVPKEGTVIESTVPKEGTVIESTVPKEGTVNAENTITVPKEGTVPYRNRVRIPYRNRVHKERTVKKELKKEREEIYAQLNHHPKTVKEARFKINSENHH